MNTYLSALTLSPRYTVNESLPHEVLHNPAERFNNATLQILSLAFRRPLPCPVWVRLSRCILMNP